MQISIQGKAKISSKLHHENQPPHHEITALLGTLLMNSDYVPYPEFTAMSRSWESWCALN